jgi:hypothetical protein
MGSGVRVNRPSPQNPWRHPAQEGFHGHAGGSNRQQNRHGSRRQPNEGNLRGNGDERGPQPEQHKSREDEQATYAGHPRFGAARGSVRQQDVSLNPLPIDPICGHQKDDDEQDDQKLDDDPAGA